MQITETMRKVIPANSIILDRWSVRSALQAPSGARARIYAYWNDQIVKVTSNEYLSNLETSHTVEFFWTPGREDAVPIRKA